MNRQTIRALISLLVATVFVAGATAARAQGMTSEQAQQMLDELKQIRQILERQPAAPGQAAPVDDKVSMQLNGGYSLGKADAPLVMVEFTDLQCPFCQQFHNNVFAQIKQNFIDTGKLRFVSKDFPLDFHENARRAATAARCAGEQGKYWEMRHLMIVNADKLQADKLISYAGMVKLDDKKFRECVTFDKFRPEIDKDIAEATAVGVNGTPTFVLGRMKDGKLEGVRIVGAMPYADFDAKITGMLTQTN
jgi:protein-disulfide isomerase